MTDISDRATEREEQNRADALDKQFRNAGLKGKTFRDSATHCGCCEEKIPLKRRRAVPGVQTCMDCQQRIERSKRLLKGSS